MNIGGLQSGKLGYFYVALAAVLFAVSGTSAKFLFHSGITPYQLIQLRTTLAFASLLIWLCLRHSALLKVSISDLPYFLADCGEDGRKPVIVISRNNIQKLLNIKHLYC